MPIGFPEDTLGLGLWKADLHKTGAAILSDAVSRLRSRSGELRIRKGK